MGNDMQQAVGAKFSVEAMHRARDRTWAVVDKVASLVQPGMLESRGRDAVQYRARDMGMERIWHPVLIRFGENTLKTFKQPSQADPRLKDDDIFFIDLGVVWDGHEGDAGATYVRSAPMRRCRPAPKPQRPSSTRSSITGAAPARAARRSTTLRPSGLKRSDGRSTSTSRAIGPSGQRLSACDLQSGVARAVRATSRRRSLDPGDSTRASEQAVRRVP
jgi:hypothetical protein